MNPSDPQTYPQTPNGPLFGTAQFVWNGTAWVASTGGGGGSSGSVTPGGTNGTAAQAVQGIPGGVPIPVSGTFTAAGAPTGTAGAPNAAVTSVQGIAGGTPQAVTQAGSTGADFSANAATVPISGFVLLATIPATPGRAAVEVQNQSASLLQVVRDDGAGNNQTTILIATGGGAGTQGGGWSSTTFKGRLRVYGPAGSQVAATQE